MDRNEFARQQARRKQGKAMQQRAMQDFAGDAQSGRAAAYDSRGRRLETGQLVVFNPPQNVLVWQVTGVDPMLDPNVAPGMLRVTLTCQVPIACGANQPTVNVLIVGKQEVGGQAQMAGDAVPQGDGDQGDGGDTPAPQIPSPGDEQAADPTAAERTGDDHVDRIDEQPATPPAAD